MLSAVAHVHPTYAYAACKRNHVPVGVHVYYILLLFLVLCLCLASGAAAANDGCHSGAAAALGSFSVSTRTSRSFHVACCFTPFIIPQHSTAWPAANRCPVTGVQHEHIRGICSPALHAEATGRCAGLGQAACCSCWGFWVHFTLPCYGLIRSPDRAGVQPRLHTMQLHTSTVHAGMAHVRSSAFD